MNFKVSCSFHLFWLFTQLLLVTQGWFFFLIRLDGCCFSHEICQYKIQVPTSVLVFALLSVSLVQTQISDTQPSSSAKLRPPSPRCSASTSGEGSWNIHSRWTKGPHRWTRTAANFSKNTHGNHDRSGRQLWIGKGGTFLKMSMHLQGPSTHLVLLDLPEKTFPFSCNHSFLKHDKVFQAGLI